MSDDGTGRTRTTPGTAPATPSGTMQTALRHWREDVPGDRLAHLVKDVARGLTRSLQMRLAEHNVSFGHWTFLRILWDKDGLTQRELSLQAGLMEPTTYSALKAMEALGYVTRGQQPDHRKKVYVHLTPLGRSLKNVLVPLAEEVNTVALRAVPPEDVAVTRRTLLAMVESLARDEAEQTSDRRRIPSTREVNRLVGDAARKRPVRRKTALDAAD
ncbi:MarR family winged helix-turn-helix transcriptional regulator [Azospirillum sp. ST 5-10]|uniref:MarR family winged helix-turn-helix transcriptional regulator n=1 Tax=unclassified Azospirillum TaxID=2630922 RepID=UPI003F4A7A55